MNEEHQIITAGQDSIKLIKNTKGYNWEIKCYEGVGGTDIHQEDLVKRIQDYDKQLKDKYGEKGGE